MKKLAFIVLCSGIIVASCKKDSTSTNSSGSKTTTTTTTTTSSTGVLLTSIIDNNPGDKDLTIINPQNFEADSVSTGYGQPVFEFTYNGTQLTKAVHYFSSKFYEAYLFSYNTQGQCTGSTISIYANGQALTGAQLGDSTAVRSTITYTGNYITEQKFYTINNALFDDVTYTWKNGEILNLIDDPSAIANYEPYANTYVYDGNNDNVDLELANGLIPVASTRRLNRFALSKGSIRSSNGNFFLSFDNSGNFSSAFPFWWVILGPNSDEASFAFGPLGNDANNPNADIIYVIPGSHNPLSDAAGNTYTYQYNSYNYPSVETVTNGSFSESVKYNYIKVN